VILEEQGKSRNNRLWKY